MNNYLKFRRKTSKSAKFDQWINQHHAALYKHALWMVGNKDIAQDVTQETFFQAWLSLHALKDDQKALPWLLTILRRCVYREQRYQYRNAETLMELTLLDGEAIQPDSYSIVEIYSALETLTPKLRDTFLLHHLHGFSYEEISTQLEIPTGTVMSRIARAREALQKYQNLEEGTIIKFSQIKLGAFDEG